jgi:hypothetical protein
MEKQNLLSQLFANIPLLYSQQKKIVYIFISNYSESIFIFIVFVNDKLMNRLVVVCFFHRVILYCLYNLSRRASSFPWYLERISSTVSNLEGLYFL